MNRPPGSSYIRGICLEEGCRGLQNYAGLSTLDRKRTYGKYCNKHRKIKNKKTLETSFSFGNPKMKIHNGKCSNCGWDKGYCDRHRIDNTIGYTPDNVRVLCPNCHRLVTMGLLNLTK